MLLESEDPDSNPTYDTHYLSGPGQITNLRFSFVLYKVKDLGEMTSEALESSKVRDL